MLPVTLGLNTEQVAESSSVDDEDDDAGHSERGDGPECTTSVSIVYVV